MIPEIKQALDFVTSDEGNFCTNLYIVWAIWLVAIWIVNMIVSIVKRKKVKR